MEELLGDSNQAVLLNLHETTIWDVAWAAIHERRDCPDRLYEQIARYHLAGYPAGGGSYDTTLILRRNCPRMHDFSRQWWDETRRSSRCENLSFHWVCHQMKEVPVLLPECMVKRAVEPDWLRRLGNFRRAPIEAVTRVLANYPLADVGRSQRSICRWWAERNNVHVGRVTLDFVLGRGCRVHYNAWRARRLESVPLEICSRLARINRPVILDLDEGLLWRSRMLARQLRERGVRPVVLFLAQADLRRDFLHWCFDSLETESLSFETLDNVPEYHVCLNADG